MHAVEHVFLEDVLELTDFDPAPHIPSKTAGGGVQQRYTSP